MTIYWIMREQKYLGYNQLRNDQIKCMYLVECSSFFIYSRYWGSKPSSYTEQVCHHDALMVVPPKVHSCVLVSHFTVVVRLFKDPSVKHIYTCCFLWVPIYCYIVVTYSHTLFVISYGSTYDWFGICMVWYIPSSIYTLFGTLLIWYIPGSIYMRFGT